MTDSGIDTGNSLLSARRVHVVRMKGAFKWTYLLISMFVCLLCARRAHVVRTKGAFKVDVFANIHVCLSP